MSKIADAARAVADAEQDHNFAAESAKKAVQGETAAYNRLRDAEERLDKAAKEEVEMARNRIDDSDAAEAETPQPDNAEKKAEGTRIGTAYVSVQPDFSGFQEMVEKRLNETLEPLGKSTNCPQAPHIEIHLHTEGMTPETVEEAIERIGRNVNRALRGLGFGEAPRGDRLEPDDDGAVA